MRWSTCTWVARMNISTASLGMSLSWSHQLAATSLRRATTCFISVRAAVRIVLQSVCGSRAVCMSARCTTAVTCIGSLFLSFTVPPWKRSTGTRSSHSDWAPSLALRSVIPTHGWQCCFWSYRRAAAGEASRRQPCASVRPPEHPARPPKDDDSGVSAKQVKSVPHFLEHRKRRKLCPSQHFNCFYFCRKRSENTSPS